VNTVKKSSLAQKLLNAPYMLWSVLFIVAPLIMVIYYAFTDTTGAFTLDNIAQIGDYTTTFILSISYGAIATVISLIIAYPFAYFLAQTKASFHPSAKPRKPTETPIRYIREA
jgi:spermidine/putrescine transport system permease protein